MFFVSIQRCSTLVLKPKCVSKFCFKPTIVTAACIFGLSWGMLDPVHADSQVPVYGLQRGSLLTCKAQSNCISTSSIKSVDKYSRPWTINSDDPDIAWANLKKAVRSSFDLKLVDEDDDNHYIRAEAKSAIPPLGIDDVEFVLNTRDKIVTYRSNSRELVYAGTQLIGDGGSNRNRLESVRRKLGWQEMGVAVEETEYLKQMENTNFFQRIQMASQPSEVNFLDDSVPAQSEGLTD
eukprot:gene3538-7037_t